MTITFNCACGKVLACKDEDAGLKGVCPKCGRKMRVPGSAKLGSREVDPAERLAKSASRVDAWIFSNQRSILIGSLAMGAVVVFAMYLYFGRPWEAADDGDEPIPPPNIPMVVDHAARFEAADATLWREDFYAFGKAVRDAMKKKENLTEFFSGKTVTWTVTFDHAFERQEVFFVEAKQLNSGNRAVAVWARLLPSEWPKTDTLKQGQKMTLRGKIGKIESARSARNPWEEIRIGAVECEILAP